VKKKNVIAFVGNGAKREINFIPELAAKECWDCKECYPLCPTSYLQAAYHLTRALAFPSLQLERAPKA
jgi:epoxyqueuosine reductase QueG